MSEKSSSRLNPVLLIVVGALVLAAVAVGVMAVAKPPADDEAAEAAPSERDRKSIRSTSGEASYTAPPKHTRKSEGGREGTRPSQTAVAAAAGLSGNAQEMFTRVSISAREELKQLREKHSTEYDDPEERRVFGVKLSQITDPTERQRVLRERTEAMRAARARADAAKDIDEREREKQLIALMQVQNLARMSEFVSKNPSMTQQANDFEAGLAEWVRESETMDSETFHATFNQLRDSLNELRRRNAQFTRPPGGTRANLPSGRPERKGQQQK